MGFFFFPFSFGGHTGPLPASLGNPGGFSRPCTGLEGEALLQELARRYVAAMGDMEGRKPGPSSILGEEGPRIWGEAEGLREPHAPVSSQAPRSCGQGSPRAIASPSTPVAPAAGPPCAAWPSASGGDGDTGGRVGTGMELSELGGWRQAGDRDVGVSEWVEWGTQGGTGTSGTWDGDKGVLERGEWGREDVWAGEKGASELEGRGHEGMGVG